VIAKRVSRSKRAGLYFPVGQIHRTLRKNYSCKRVGKLAPIYLTAVLEYTMAEVLETAGVLTRLLSDGKRGTDLKITPRHLRLAIVNDAELSKVFDGAILPSSGGGNHISRKNMRQIRGAVGDTSDEEEEVVVRGKGRKGVHRDSRANSKDRRDEEEEEVISLDSDEDDLNARKKKNKGVIKSNNIVKANSKNRRDDEDVICLDSEEEEEDSLRTTKEGPQGGVKNKKGGKKTKYKNKKVKNCRGSFGASLMPEVDAKTFDKCKRDMRAVKETIIAMDSGSEDQSSRRCLVKIGNHIESLFVHLPKEEARDWRYNYWFYISNFSDMDAQQLCQLYNAIKEETSTSQTVQ